MSKYSLWAREDLEQTVELQREELYAINGILKLYGIDLKRGRRGVRELADMVERGLDGDVCTCSGLASGFERHAVNCEGFPNHYATRWGIGARDE